MDAVRRSREDVPSDTEDPLFPVHFGLDLSGDEGGRPDEE
jgi:beta-glucosidase